MNSFVLRLVFGHCKATLQIFLKKNTAMCFTKGVINFFGLFDLLSTKYGLVVKSCRLCATVWSLKLMSRLGELSKFYTYCHMNLNCFFVCLLL